jgi:hypothetical protein
MVEISDGDWEERQGLAFPADFARQLERELTAAKEEVQLLQTLLKQRDSENAETLAEAVKIEDERNLLRTESQEQARLLGMSGEREADLRGEIERLRRRVEAADGQMRNISTLVHLGRTDYIDWAKLTASSPDYEPGYKPDYPDWLIKIDQAIQAYRATEGKK